MATAERPYRFAIQGGPFGDTASLTKHAQMIEALGYDEFFTSDHIGAPGGAGKGKYVVDPFIPLMVASAATTTLRVGTLVLNNEFWNPSLLARTAATVDRLSDGRLVLGLGTGYAASEHDAIGQTIRPPGPRVTRFAESLHILRALLDEGSVDYDGEHDQAHFDDVGVRPAQSRVPFLIGGHGRRVVRLAGQHADIFQFTGLTHAADGTPQAGGFGLADLTERASWLADASGDRNARIERSALVQMVACGDDVPSVDSLASDMGIDADIVAETPFVLSGSVEQIVDKIERLRDSLGITHYVVRSPEEFAPVVDALTSSTRASTRSAGAHQ